jgi:hypothetical protein
MTIAILTPIWGRHELVRLAQHQLAIASDGLDVERWIVGSEGKMSSRLAAKCGAQYVEAPNLPLGRKVNIGLRRLRRYDGVLAIGSDDLLTAGAMRRMIEHPDADICGFLDCYRYIPSRDQLLYWPGYDGERKGETAGCRYYGRRLLELLEWQLWDEKRNSGLDGSAMARIWPHLRMSIAMRLGEDGMVGTEYEAITSVADNPIMQPVEVDRLTGWFGQVADDLRCRPTNVQADAGYDDLESVALSLARQIAVPGASHTVQIRTTPEYRMPWEGIR